MGHSAEALRLYTLAAEAFDANHMALYAAACRYRRGELLANDEGRALIDAAEALMRSETVKNPARMVEMFVSAGARAPNASC
jgi:hypothetical protein